MSRDIVPGGNYISCGNPTKLGSSGSAVGTLAAWVWPDGVSIGTAWFHTYANQWGWGLNGANLRFTKFNQIDIPSTLPFVAGEWQFAAVVAHHANIHYFRMTAAGVITTRDIANGNVLTSGPSDCRIGAFAGEQIDGAIAHLACWIGAQYLSDDELVCYARGVFPRQPTFYAPLWGTAYPEADLTPAKATLTQVGSVVARGHPPISPYLLAA